MAEVTTRKGEKVLVDDEDLALLSRYPWYISKQNYVVYDSRHYVKENGKLKRAGKMTLMHRLITNCPVDKQVDHINHDTLDNRKSNLRVVEAYQNARNTRKHKDNRSGYKGVSRDKKKWCARLTVKGKTINLGYYTTPELAYEAYKAALPISD